MTGKQRLSNIVKALILPIGLYAIFAIIAPTNFVSLVGLQVIITSAVVYTLIGWGVCFNLVVGTWDFSAGAAIALASVFAADASNYFGLPGMIIVAVIAAWACEIITGLVYLILKIPTLITTIGILLIYETGTAVYKDGKSFTIPGECSFLGQFPYILILLAIGGIVFEILYNHTVLGHHIKAVGHGASVAKTVGINPTKIKFLCFLAGGAIIAVATIAYLAYGTTSVAKTNFETMSSIFQPMMGVTIALALEKYCRLTIGVFIGELCIKIITQGLVATGASSSMQQIVTGIALLAVFSFSAISLKLSDRSEKKARMAAVRD
jgi:ribose transport system permease protein